MSATSKTRTARTHRRTLAIKTYSYKGVNRLGWVLASETFAGGLGFLVLVHQARHLGPASFATFEYASAVLAWMLVLVRGGVDVIVYREAARHPRLIRPLTDLLIGIRLVAAAIGYVLILMIAALVGAERGGAVAIAGLALFVSARVSDVGLRATFRMRELAAAQVVRSLGVAASIYLVIQGPADLLAAAFCLIAAECFGAFVPLWCHSKEHGWPRPRITYRAAIVLSRRGAVTGLTRFTRVTLYGLDILILGSWAASEYGPYAAARRLVFAMIALGLVVPAVLGPAIARAWCEGTGPAKKRIAEALAGLWSLSLPAAVGIAITADRWMPLLFGEAYRGGGPWLALVAARLPWLLTASFAQAALVACRREEWSLRLALGQLLLAVLIFPPALYFTGPWGLGWGSQVVEMAGAVAGWAMLARLGIAPGINATIGRAFKGCLAMVVVCRFTKEESLATVVIAGSLVYGFVWWVTRRRLDPVPREIHTS